MNWRSRYPPSTRFAPPNLTFAGTGQAGNRKSTHLLDEIRGERAGIPLRVLNIRNGNSDGEGSGYSFYTVACLPGQLTDCPDFLDTSLCLQVSCGSLWVWQGSSVAREVPRAFKSVRVKVAEDAESVARQALEVLPSLKEKTRK